VRSSNEVVRPLARGDRIKAEMSRRGERAARGLVDAELGGGVLKHRCARPGQGRSAVFACWWRCRSKDRAVFVFGFAKNERETIDAKELAVGREVAASLADSRRGGRLRRLLRQDF